MRVTVVAAMVFILTACGSAAAPPPPPPPTAATTTVSATAREICRVDAVDGTYYLVVTSAFGDLSACAAGTPIPENLDALLTLAPGMDRRCVYDPVADPNAQAIVGVYSSSDDDDQAAAAVQCTAHHGVSG